MCIQYHTGELEMNINICSIVVAKWLLFNSKQAIFQLYLGENKCYSMRDDDVRFILDQHT